MLASISGKQLTEWIAYAELEPFGEWRADLRIAILASLIANANRDQKLKPTPFEISDFMPQFEKKEPMSEEDAIAAMMTAFVHATGGNGRNGKS
jgi:hypothetical protein